MDKLSRNQFLKRVGLFSLGAASGAAILSACSGGGSPEATESAPAKEPAQSMYSKKKGFDDLPDADCSQYNQNLSDADLNTRNSVEYVEKSANKEQYCSNCQFWQADKFEGDCGGCQLFANGAVSPKGYCKSWAAKQAS